MLPLPSRSHPQKQNRAVYTKELTHLLTNAAPRSVLEGYQTSNNNEHVNYIGTDNNVYELVYK
jgi:hypothetical protein